VHKSVAKAFCEQFCKAMAGLSAGPPFGKHPITPLPEPDKPKYLEELVADAKAHGASIINECGGQTDRTLVFPSVLYPVTKDMRAYQEEQFGPLIPIAEYEDIEEVTAHIAAVKFGQQVSLFTGAAENGGPALAKLLDECALCTCRVNINVQCQRGPDVFPFAGRKSSALGTISVSEVLRAVSVETMVAGKSTPDVEGMAKDSAVFPPVARHA